MQATKCVFVALFIFCDTSGMSGGVRNVFGSEDNMIDIAVNPKGTILSFVVKPTKVILGESGSFSLEYVERDIAISPATLNSTSNLYVYLLGRRYGFRLSASEKGADDVVIVKDQSEKGEKK